MSSSQGVAASPRGHKRKASDPHGLIAGVSSPIPGPSQLVSPTRSPTRRGSTRTFQISLPEDDGPDWDDYDDEQDAEGEEDDEYNFSLEPIDELDDEGDADADAEANVHVSDARNPDDEIKAEARILTRAETRPPPTSPSRSVLGARAGSSRPRRSAAAQAQASLVLASSPLEQASSPNEEAEQVVDAPTTRRRSAPRRVPLVSSSQPPSEMGYDHDHVTTSDGPAAGNPEPMLLEDDSPKATPRSPLSSARTPKDSHNGAISSVAESAETEAVSAEVQAQTEQEKEEQDLRARWMEEYFEIVEQLPLEVHRTFALLRELEGQMQTKFNTIVQGTIAYRDARLQLDKWIERASRRDQGNSSNNDALNLYSEDEAEDQLGQSTRARPDNVAAAALGSSGSSAASDASPSTMAAALKFDGDGKANSDAPGVPPLDKQARRELLKAISHAANEAVKAAEEKMGLASTAYNSIDRHIRRLDADIDKMESSILLGLRSGTEESRGVREALGLPIDDGTDEPAAQDHDDRDDEREDGTKTKKQSGEAETAALAKAAAAANKTASEEMPVRKSGRRSATTTPKVGGQAELPDVPSPSAPSGTRRSRSASTAPESARVVRPRKPSSTASQSGTGAVTVIAAAAGAGAGAGAGAAGQKPARTRKPKPRPKSMSAAVAATAGGRKEAQSGEEGATEISGMRYDPTEPRYCYCDQVSFGNMVACDNDDCELEWFHYQCVGLESQPRGKWYCRFCAPVNWKGPGMGVPANAKFKPPGWKKGGIKP